MPTSLDSCVLIDLANGVSVRLRNRYIEAKAKGVDFVVSALAYQEVVYGAVLSRRFEAQMRKLAAVMGEIPVVPFTETDGVETARLRAQMRWAGQAVGGLDTLIGGQAVARGWAVATSNLKDFTRVPGLDIEDWTP